MNRQGFAERLEAIISYAKDLSEVWTNTHISDKLDMEIESVMSGVVDGEAEDVTYELLPQLKETITYADTELRHSRG